MIYADSSSIVKLYADEASADLVRSLPEPFVVSALIQVEVTSALWRKHRIGELAEAHVATLTAAFRADLLGIGLDRPRFDLIAVSASILAEATFAVARHGLRSLDAIQLASALAARAATAEPTTIVAFDGALRSAASAEGCALAPESIS